MNKEKRINVLVLSIYRDLAESFTESLTPEQIEQVTIADHLAHFDIVAGDPAEEPGFKEHMSKADALAIVIRFMDVLSLEKLKAIYRHLPTESVIPVGIFMLRDKGEIDFKISCPSCGQKLWLRDTDIGKRGRCPNCKKPFVILSQSDHIKSQLMLPDGIPIMQVERGDSASFRNAITKLLESVAGGIIEPMVGGRHVEALKNATVRIQIQES